MKLLKTTLLAAAGILSILAMTPDADAGYWSRQRHQNYNFVQRQGRQAVRRWDNRANARVYVGPARARVIVR